GQLLTVGVDYQRERIDSDVDYLHTRRDNTGGYAQYQGEFGRDDLQLSVRRDHNQQFGNHTTGAAAWGHAFDPGLPLTARWGPALHAPTFNDVYYPFGSGNPDLQPEKSHSAELGLSQHVDTWNWAVNAYQTNIDKLIVSVVRDGLYVTENVSKARIRG